MNPIEIFWLVFWSILLYMYMGIRLADILADITEGDDRICGWVVGWPILVIIKAIVEFIGIVKDIVKGEL